MAKETSAAGFAAVAEFGEDLLQSMDAKTDRTPYGDGTMRGQLAAVEDVFAKIGTTRSTQMPTSRSNNSAAAMEYFLAETLVRLAKNRFDAAKKAAEEQGVFGEEADYKEGESVMTFNSKDVVVTVKRGKGGTLLDRDKLKAALAKRHNNGTVTTILEEGSKERKGTTTITTAMK